MKYQIGEVSGSNGTQWAVGKSDSDTEIFYFPTLLLAMAKLIELNGAKSVLRAINSHEDLLETACIFQEHYLANETSPLKERVAMTIVRAEEA